MIVYDAEPQCPPFISTITLPSREKTDCIQAATGQALKNLIIAKNIQPNSKSPCYPFFGQMFVNCIDVAVRTYPAISYGLSSHYLKGSLYGQPWEGCAAGVSGDPIRVTLAQPPRELALIAWESANYWMWITMDRLDLTDGDYIAQVTNTAMSACNL